MAYNTFPNPYATTPWQNPNAPWQNSTTAPPQQYVPYQAPRFNQNTFDWVQGEAAASIYQVSPGSTVVLMDTEKPILYMKSADQTGKPSPMEIRYLVTKEEYEKIQNNVKPDTSYVTKDDLDAAIDKLRSQFRKENKNGKSSV